MNIDMNGMIGTKLWAVMVLLRNNTKDRDCHALVVFKSAKTEKEARDLTEEEFRDYSGHTIETVEAHLVPFNPAPPIPSWLSKLKRGDIVCSDYRSHPGELTTYEFIEVCQLNHMGSGFGVWLLIDGEPTLLDSSWLERPLDSFK